MKKFITLIATLTVTIAALTGCVFANETPAAEEPEDTALVEAPPQQMPEPQTFVLIKLSDQKLWVLKNTNVTDSPDGCQILFESGIVSGTAGTDRATPTGTFKVENKVNGTYLRPSDGGKVWVDYWIPFVENSIGMHDATWRGEEEFGTDQYKVSGSHGCINLPHSAAETLWGLVNVGTPVRVVD